MSEYWKSTPSYWCKFCSIYVRDTGIERKNHEASVKHQNSIQRSLRDLHKGKEREEREKQRAKDEVARLNGLVSGEKKKASPSPAAGDGKRTAAPPPIVREPVLDPATERRKRAEQLVAMGVKLPEELERELMGVGGWQTVSERVIEEGAPIKHEGDEESKPVIRGVHKRKAEDDEGLRDEEAAPKTRKAWGSSLRTYPGAAHDDEEDAGDLDALLSGVKTKKPTVKGEDDAEVEEGLKREQSQDSKPLDAIPDVDAPAAAIKKEDTEEAVTPVVFKKRKNKR